MCFNKLAINESKTHCILFHNKFKYNVRDITLENHIIDLVHSTKLLGIIFDENLKWNFHVDALCKELASICYALLNLRRSCSASILRTYYYSNFYSRMVYGIIHWGCGSDVNRIFLLQKRAMRIVFNRPFRESCRELFKSELILTFYDAYILEVLCYVYKYKHEFSSISAHGYNTRNDFYLLPPRHTTALFQKNLLFLGCKIYNKLPNRFKIICNSKLFKSSVKKYLYSISCYSIEDYFLYQCV